MDSSPTASQTGSSNAADIPRVRNLEHLVDSQKFNAFIALLIILNAIVLGGMTHRGWSSTTLDQLSLLNDVLFVCFIVELILRIASYGRRPWNFFRDPWNVFDFIIIGGALLPGIREQAMILRLLRLARIARIIRVMPSARALIATVIRALPAVWSMLVLTVVFIYIYGMIGWMMFGEALPELWGTIGRSMLTLFVLLTLENFPQYLSEAQQVTDWATAYFLSYVLIGSFIIVNLFIGIIISATEQIRRERDAQDVPDQLLARKITELQSLLETYHQRHELLGQNDPPAAESDVLEKPQ